MVTAPNPVRARLGTWPYQPEIAHLVLLDHNMVPDEHHVRDWVDEARRRGARAIRTGAVFPRAAPAFLTAGFEPIDRLALLDLDLTGVHLPPTSGAPGRLQRLRRPRLDAAARVDAAAFGSTWANDAATLAEINDATPHHRARHVVRRGDTVAFAISGRARTSGYVQRLAVHPDHRRNGIGRHLLHDALGWMRRRGVRRVMVNTAVDNVAALRLYEQSGFRRSGDTLVMLELDLGTDRVTDRRTPAAP
jgi:GNAT superfamily N-acetyltransferase